MDLVYANVSGVGGNLLISSHCTYSCGTYETSSEEGEVTRMSVFGNDRTMENIRVTVVVGSDGSDDSVVKL